jgi:phosphate-selective porin
VVEAQPPAARPDEKEPTVAIGGLLQVQTEVGDQGDSRFSDDNDRIYLRRARLNATGRLLADFEYRLEGDFAGGLSNSSSLRAQLTDGFVTWTRYPAATVRFGQLKTPYGFEQLYADPRLYSLERSLVNDRLTLGRQVGVQVAGGLLNERLTYAVGAFNGNGVNNNFNDNDRFLLAGRVAGVPWQGRLLGERGSWAAGANAFSSEDSNIPAAEELGFDSTPATPERDDVFAGKRRGFGLDTQLQWGRWELWAEYLDSEWEPDSRLPRRRVEADGWYALGTVYLVPEKLQAVLKIESFDPRGDLPDDTTETLTAGLNWQLKGHDLKLGVDYLRVEQDGEPDQDKVLARFQLAF